MMRKLIFHLNLNCALFLTAIAQVYKEEGNAEYRKKEFRNAASFYTEGIDVKCKDDQLNAILYTNRATSYFCLGELTRLEPS